MQINKVQQIRKNRQNIRIKTKCQLKLPNISHKMSLNSPEISTCQSGRQKIYDTREFKNVFQLMSKIGQGANGIVKMCKQIKTGDIYAVKIIKGDEQFIRITKRTYQILKLFDNSSIIKAKYLFIDERVEKIYLVMQYCDYPSLNQVLGQNNFTVTQCKKIIKKLLQALNQLHSKNVCHRDLKPSNILYNKEKNQIKIIDFGVSKITYNKKKNLKQKMWTVTGTIHYKAPQMFLGGQYDQMIDMWAVGIITYELIYKKLPFDSEYNTEIIEKITQKQPQYQQLFDNEQSLTIDFIKALLRKNKNHRINCTTALRHPWIQNLQLKNNNKKYTSQDCFSTQFFFDRQTKNNINVQKIQIYSPGSMKFIDDNDDNNYLNIEKQKLAWKKFEQGIDILQIPKQNDEITWISMKRSISRDQVSNSLNDSKKLEQSDEQQIHI